jgi:hypothetical protein
LVEVSVAKRSLIPVERIEGAILDLRFQFGRSRWGGTRMFPRAFTEQQFYVALHVIQHLGDSAKKGPLSFGSAG